MTDTEYDTSDTETDTSDDEFATDYNSSFNMDIETHPLLVPLPLNTYLNLIHSPTCADFKRRLEHTGLEYFVLINYWRNHPNKDDRIDFSDGLYVINKVLKQVIHCDFYPIRQKKDDIISSISASKETVLSYEFEKEPSFKSIRMTSIFKHPSPSGFGICSVVNALDQDDNEFMSHIVDVEDVIKNPISAFSNEYGFIPAKPFIDWFYKLNERTFQIITSVQQLLDIFLIITPLQIYKEHTTSWTIWIALSACNDTLVKREPIITWAKTITDILYAMSEQYDINDVIYIILQLMNAKRTSALYHTLQTFKESRETAYETYHKKMFKLVSQLY
jgi:hypothetical protein